MNADDLLTGHFEAARPRLRAVAYRMLGSLHDADDVVQTVWLKASRAYRGDVAEPAAWLTTVTARECLDQLRARKRRHEVLVPDHQVMGSVSPSGAAADEELLMAESVGRALLVVLDRMTPMQRVTFILHDVFAVPFDEVGRMLNRSTVAVKKLAQRARERLYGRFPDDREVPAEHLELAHAFLSAARGGDLPRLLELLAPDVVRRVDGTLIPRDVPAVVRGAREVAEETKMFTARARAGEVALIRGVPGIVIAPAGRLQLMIRLSIHSGRITAIDVIGDRLRLADTTVNLLPAAG